MVANGSREKKKTLLNDDNTKFNIFSMTVRKNLNVFKWGFKFFEKCNS